MENEEKEEVPQV